MNINDTLLQTIKTLVKQEINNAPFDKTRQAVVLTNNNDGTYKIRLDGNEYDNIPSYPSNVIIAIGSVVKVIIPNNQYSQMFISNNAKTDFIITTVTKTLSNGIEANTYIPSADISMTEQTGYTAIGIVGWSTTHWRIRPTTNYIKNNTTIYAGFANDTSTAVTSSVTMIFRVLWVK